MWQQGASVASAVASGVESGVGVSTVAAAESGVESGAGGSIEEPA